MMANKEGSETQKKAPLHSIVILKRKNERKKLSGNATLMKKKELGELCCSSTAMFRGGHGKGNGKDEEGKYRCPGDGARQKYMAGGRVGRCQTQRRSGGKLLGDSGSSDAKAGKVGLSAGDNCTERRNCGSEFRGRGE